MPVGTRRSFVTLLQAAYSGELAAARAYHGHWRSVHDEQDRAEIQRIEQAELHHRRLVGEMLAELGAGPARWRELLMGTIGRSAGAMCHVSGRFLPMYVAGWLEAINVNQYATGATHASALGLDHFLVDLRDMVEEEQRHERFFAARAAGHRLLPVVRWVGRWDPDRVS
ncbi:MAG: ferritin-like domain-containing protein [Acidimicrobiales bacterium]